MSFHERDLFLSQVTLKSKEKQTNGQTHRVASVQRYPNSVVLTILINFYKAVHSMI